LEYEKRAVPLLCKKTDPLVLHGKRISYFLFQKNPPQTSEILKSEIKLKPFKAKAFLQKFSSLAYIQVGLNKFLTFFQHNFKKIYEKPLSEFQIFSKLGKQMVQFSKHAHAKFQLSSL
jgi:hypothetical protein